MNTVKKKFAERLTALRGQQSIYEVAKDVGIHRSLLHRYEQGIKIPGDDNLQKLSTYYETDFDELKILMIEDQFPEGSKDRELLLKWLRRLE